MTDAEITAIADECGMYECHDNGRINGNTVLDFARAVIAAQLAAPVAAQEPVAWMLADGSSAISLRCKEDGQHRGEGWVNAYTVLLYEASQPAQGERQPTLFEALTWCAVTSQYACSAPQQCHQSGHCAKRP